MSTAFRSRQIVVVVTLVAGAPLAGCGSPEGPIEGGTEVTTDVTSSVPEAETDAIGPPIELEGDSRGLDLPAA